MKPANYLTINKYRMKNIIALFISILLINTSTYSEVKRICKVKYETEDGWSKEYTMEVEFVTGFELNKKTQSFNYNSYSKYCCIWFSDGGVAIIEIDDYISLQNSDNEFDDDTFKSTFSYKYSITGKQVNGDKDTKTKWEIDGRDYRGYIDPRDNDN